MVFSTILDVDFKKVMKNFVAQRTEIHMRYATFTCALLLALKKDEKKGQKKKKEKKIHGPNIK